MPLDQCLADCLLTFAVVVNIAGVEVAVACCEKCIDHLIELVVVKIGRTVFDGQAHHAKS